LNLGELVEDADAGHGDFVARRSMKVIAETRKNWRRGSETASRWSLHAML